MQLLWIILRALFPNDPVQQCIGAARHRIALMASEVFSPQSLFLLEHDPRARLHIEALIIDYEAALHMAIGARACQIAKMRFRFRARAYYRPTRALSVEALLARIRALVTMANNIERLAQIRAERLKRERDADPLGLSQHTHLTAQPYLRSSRRTPGPRADLKACSALQLQGCAGLAIVPGSRLSSGRAGLEYAQTPARRPPPTIVSPHPKPASQPHLRERGPVRIDNFLLFHHIPPQPWRPRR